MTAGELAKSYLIKAEKRLKILEVLLNEEDYSDVVREAQEIVELCLKGVLRSVGIEPPKWHDVGPLLLEYEERVDGVSHDELARAAKISKILRRDRELAFYGDIDFIPTEEFTRENATESIEGTRFVLDIARRVIRRT